ncbi:hypothetical protein Tco_0864183 [Tanacetum coccineum]
MATEGRATVERDIEVVVWWQRLLLWMVLLRVLAVVGDEWEEECGKDSPEKSAGEDGGSPEKSIGKVSPWKGMICFGKKGKLASRYVEPFEILERIGSIAYRLRLPEELSSVHDTFHVSNLEKKCLADANLHVPLDEIEADKTLRFVEEPKGIMDREI